MSRKTPLFSNNLGPEPPMFSGRDVYVFRSLQLAIDKKSLGSKHPNVATDLNNLASLLRAINRLAEGEPLYRRALAICEKSFGPNHPNVATGLNNLALLLRATRTTVLSVKAKPP